MSTFESKIHTLRTSTAVRIDVADHSMSNTDIKNWLICKKRFARIRALRNKTKQDLKGFLGTVTHDAVAEPTKEGVERVIKESMDKLPEAERPASEKAVREFIAMAESKRSQFIVEQWKERKLKYTLPNSQVTLVTVPDEINKEVHPETGECIEIVEYKTGKKLGASTKDQLFLAGLIIACLSYRNGWIGPIRLVALSLATGEKKVWYFPRNDIEELIARLEAIDADIQAATKTKAFEHTASRRCEFCPILHDCRQGKQWMARWEEAGRPYEETPAQILTWRKYVSNGAVSSNGTSSGHHDQVAA